MPFTTPRTTDYIQTHDHSGPQTGGRLNASDLIGFADLVVTSPPAPHTHPWADIYATPTTIGGYGITDFNTLGDARWSPLTPADNVFRIVGNVTPTKKLAFEVDGFTALTTRTLTPQDANYTIAGTNVDNAFSANQTFFGDGTFSPVTIAASLLSGQTVIRFLDTDNSKYGFWTSEGITGAAKTWTFPNVTGNVPMVTAQPAAGTLVYGAGATTVMANLGIGTAGQILTVNAGATAPQWSTNASIVDIARTWQTLQTYKTSTLKIVDPTDATKTAVFALSGATTGADLTLAWAGTVDRTVTIPDGTTTLAGLGLAQTFTLPQAITPTTDAAALTLTQSAISTGNILTVNNSVPAPVFTIDNIGAANFFSIKLWPSGNVAVGFYGEVFSAATADRTYTLPDSSGTVVLENISATLRAAVGSVLISSTASSGASFTDTTTSTKKLRAVLSGAVGNNSLTLTNTAARNYGLRNEAGDISIVGGVAVASGANAAAQAPGKVDVAAQGADFLQAQIVTTPTAGFWRLDSVLVCTTAGAGSGTMTTTWGWTDSLGATTDATQTQALTATGRAAQATCSRIVYVASGHITVKCLITGAYLLGAQYAFRARATFLG